MIQRNIAIVGAGEAGLKLGIGLRKIGHYVSIFTNKSADTLLSGQILSSQGVFGSALEIDKNLGINFWDSIAPANRSVTFTLVDPIEKKKMINFQGITNKPYQSVDQRVKFAKWMEKFEQLGGKLNIQDIGLAELNSIANEHDLTIVASGKGEISKIFPINKLHSHFDKPQRALACLYAHGIKAAKNPAGVRANMVPSVGEFFIMPGTTLTGSCEMMLFEGIPGGPFDCWNEISAPAQRLEKALELIKQYFPWEFERCQNATLTDNNATLAGRYTPVIKQPIVKLPCKKSVLGIGDAIVLNDPIAGQGANHATKAAAVYLQRIANHNKPNFSEQWMQETHNLSWEKHGKWSSEWSRLLLTPPAEHVLKLLEAATHSTHIANIIAEGFNDPASFFPWIIREEDTLKLIHDIKATERFSKNEILSEICV